MLSPTGVHPALHISAIRTRFVKVPMRFPPGTSATTVNSAPLLLVDLETREGVVGHSYLFCYRESGAKAIADIVQEAAGLIDGMAVTPMKLMDFLAKQYTLLGVAGVARMALVCFQKLACICSRQRRPRIGLNTPVGPTISCRNRWSSRMATLRRQIDPVSGWRGPRRMCGAFASIKWVRVAALL
jgi:hypothetical protein